MFLYEKKLVLKNDSICIEKITYVPCEGFTIPLNFHLIHGFGKQLYQTGFIDRKRRPLIIFIHLDDEFENYNLCIKYKNGKFRIVPKIGFKLEESEIQKLSKVVQNHQIT